MDWIRASVGEMKRALMAEEVDAKTLTQVFLDRIDSIESNVGAWLHVAADSALECAEAIDKKRARGESLGPLAGIPIGIKDMISTKSLPTTAGSQILRGYVPPYDATVVSRLKAADAVILGKLNQDEFAMGSSNEHSAYHVCRNPWRLSHVPGGSSGGSAAAVAAAMCPVSLGTDTGGSIRQPASFCGLVGLKPTYGRVSRYGVIAFASSLDQVGPLGRTVGDVAEVLNIIAGHDPVDSTSLDAASDDYTLDLDGEPGPFRLGIAQEYFGEGIAPEVRAAVEQAITVYEQAGATIVPVSLPHTEHAIATYYLLATAEASSNLARYDGIRYGRRTDSATQDIETLISQTRTEGFGPEVKRRIMLGAFVLSSGYYDAYYLKAQKVRTLIRRDFDRAFEACDALLTPTSPVTAFEIGARISDPLQMYLMDALTIPASLAGLPCLSQPAGFDEGGLPIGLQLVGPTLEEHRLLKIAAAYESRTDWHLKCPPEVSDAS